MIDELDTQSLHDRLNKKLVIDTNDNKSAIDLLQSLGLQPTTNKNDELEIIETTGTSFTPDFIASTLVGKGIGLNKLIPLEEDLESLFLRLIKSIDK
jgi:hypothetical protein